MSIISREQADFVSVFLEQYWQKKPCVIKQFSPNFVDPIDENDLAGLAQEEGVDSRIVSSTDAHTKQAKNWQVHQGPFEDFEQVCENNWSLLVQGVDKYIDEVNDLTKLVDFIPHWRLDDVMVSYSMPNAGVGAHTDEYDVFIVQGKGSRRWQVGLPCVANTVIPHPLLKQIEGFEAVIDQELGQGDAIYIPPKHPHSGLALSHCLNYSIGFRAPTSAELLIGMLDESENFAAVQSRYADPNITELRTPEQAQGEISIKEINQLKQGILDMLNTPLAEQALFKYLSSQQLPSFNDDPETIRVEELHTMLKRGASLAKMPAVRVIFAQTQTLNTRFNFYIDGNVFEANMALSAFLKQMFEVYELSYVEIKQSVNPELLDEFLGMVCALVNLGYWELLDTETLC